MARATTDMIMLVIRRQSEGVDSRKLLMWLFLTSDCMFFGTLIATYMTYRNRSIDLQMPPYPNEIFDIPYTSVSAFVLLMSSLTMVLALAAIQRGNHRGLRIWLGATALLGSIFVGGQVSSSPPSRMRV